LYLIGFVPYILGQLYVRGLIVLKKTNILMRCSLLSIILNVILNYIFIRKLGVGGIALATTVVSLFSLCYFKYAFVNLVKKEI